MQQQHLHTPRTHESIEFGYWRPVVPGMGHPDKSLIHRLGGDDDASEDDDDPADDAAAAAGKVRVWAILCDVSGVDETDRNTDAQHDTGV